MSKTGRCYCGEVTYSFEGEPVFKAECHCRECQYIAGGAPAFVMGVPEAGFTYTQGQPRQFTRSDIDNAVTREFCPNCGTHLLTRPPQAHNMGLVMLKVGTLDEPASYGGPQMVIYCREKQSFHILPEGVPAFDTVPTGIGEQLKQ